MILSNKAVTTISRMVTINLLKLNISVVNGGYQIVTGFGKMCIVHTSDFAHSKVHNT